MRANKIIRVSAIMLLVSLFLSSFESTAATYLSMSGKGIVGGRVTNISKRKVEYRKQTGSSPESWGKVRKLKIGSYTKFYRCVGYNSSYTKYKLKRVSKSKAIKAIYNNGSNYVFIKVRAKKAIKMIYGMENYVG